MNKLIDIGVNLAHASFRTDKEQVIKRATAAGVEHIVITGTSVKNSQIAARMASEYPGVLYSTAGVHPHDAKNCNQETISILRGLAKRKEVVAIGECGLDFNRDFSPRDVQEKWFDAQVQLACELNMPLFLHDREAHSRFVHILSNYTSHLPKAVVHCFTGTADELDNYLSMGMYIGITGWICDERRGKDLQELVKRIPLDRLMLETDAPFLTPRTIKPKPLDGRNEPAFLPYVLQTVAKCLGKSESEVAESTTRTGKAFFEI